MSRESFVPTVVSVIVSVDYRFITQKSKQCSTGWKNDIRKSALAPYLG